MPAIRLHLLLQFLLLASCESRYDGFGYEKELHPADVRNFQHDLINHEEPGWDRLGLWRRLEGKPPRFVPRDMPRHVPVDEKHGSWTLDAADGSRFFVPKGGTPHYSETVLLAEARKSTNKISKGRSRTLNILGPLIFWPMAVTLSAAQPSF